MNYSNRIIAFSNRFARVGLCLLFTAGLLVTGCASTGDTDDRKVEPGELDLIICEEPRPQICTREYAPVCATLKDGATRTGSTGCTSCSDTEVVGYRIGACEGETVSSQSI